jgi:MoaA/NifB/PqqE/SkfB family radical SAM enzyme
MYPFSIDFELTNRCNASCHFCPRDRTPHQGLMSPETFEQGLMRAVEYREQVEAAFAPDPVQVEVSLCGLGEPLLNKHAAEFVRAVRAEGFRCSMSSNGALLDERRGRAVLDAGLQHIYINIGDVGDDYEDVYKLPFEKTRDNIVRFIEMAEGRCEVCIVLVDYKADPVHVDAMRDYWRNYGVETFQSYEIMNRGGSLFVDHMQYESFGELAEAERLLTANDSVPVCGAPFAFLFIGYDSHYYLCCSDWEKRAPLGSVFDSSFLDVTAAKLAHTIDRQVVCKSCNLDPINQLTEVIQTAAETGDREPVEAMVGAIRTGSDAIIGALDRMGVGPSEVIRQRTVHRPRIPVVAES